MTNKAALKMLALVAALAASGLASAEVINLSDQYTLHTSYTKDAAHQYQYTFTYTVDNVNQGIAGTQTGLDGFTVYIPTSAHVISAAEPDSYIPGQGYWTKGASPSLDLSYGGSTTQNMQAKDGYLAYTFWGQYTGSVYQKGTSATFSLTLDNVSVGTNTVGISSYYGGYAVPSGQDYVTNPYGHYTTFTTNAMSAVTAVPEPETYAMMLAGLGAVGFIARRRRKA